MQRCEQVAVAEWLVGSGTPWHQLATFGPAGFESYARLRFIPDPEFVGQDEGDVAIPEDHPPNVDSARRALRRLEPFTDTADECYFCVWDGLWTPEAAAAFPGSTMVTIPERRYALFTGPLNEITRWEQTFSLTAAPELGPAFVWPADRRWCFARDVDPHWAGIGAERTAIDALVVASDIDVTYADPEHPQASHYYNT